MLRGRGLRLPVHVQLSQDQRTAEVGRGFPSIDEPERDEKRDAAVVIQQGLPWLPRMLHLQHLTGAFCYKKHIKI